MSDLINSNTLVSVVVPHFNRNELIDQLVENVAQQQYRPIELLIIDDGSDVCPSFSESALKYYQKTAMSVDVFRLEHTGRPGLVRNVGIKKAKGDYIAFLDSDDRWLPEKLVIQLAILESNADIGLVHSDALLKDEGREFHYLANKIQKNNINYVDLLKYNYVLTSSVVGRSEILKNNLFRDFPSAQDYELWLRLKRTIKFYYLPDATFRYNHQRTDSISRRGGRRYLCLLRIFRRELHYVEKYEHLEIIKRRLAGIYLKLAKWSFYKGRKNRCRKLVFKSFAVRANFLALITLILLICAPNVLSYLYARTRDF